MNAPSHHEDERALGAVAFSTEVDVPVAGDALFALATDLERYTAAEPRLKQARWLDDDAPRVGSRAAIVGEIPFTVPVVRQVVGDPRGTAVLEEFVPPERLTYRLDTGRAQGRMSVAFRDTPDGCVVSVRGWIVPRNVLGRLALAPLAAVLRPLADQAVQRGVLRAAAALR